MPKPIIKHIHSVLHRRQQYTQIQ